MENKETPVTVQSLMEKLSNLDPRMEVTVFSRQGSGIMRAYYGESSSLTTEIDIVEEDYEGRTIFSQE